MTDLETEAQEAPETETETLRDRGAQIAAMVEEEEARVIAEEAAEEEAEAAGFPCPVCGTHMEIPNVPEQDPETERCSQCKGWGMTASGSLLPDAAVGPCSKCSGRGYTNIAPVYIPPSDFTHTDGENGQRVAVVDPALPPIVMPDPATLKLGA